MVMPSSQHQAQEALYSFPYHYIPMIDAAGIPRITRSLSWGIEYLTYIAVVRKEIKAVLNANERLLDIGCGDGYLLNSLGFDIQKHGVDLSSRAIAFAKAFATDAVFEIRDIQELTAEYDAVTCIEVLEHIPDEALNDFVSGMIRLIKPSGYLIVSVPTTVVKLNKKHYRHYDEALLSEHLEKSQKLELIKEQRVCRTSRILSLIQLMLHNQLWTVNFAPLLKAFWKWHCRSNIIASLENGAHLIRVYKKY